MTLGTLLSACRSRSEPASVAAASAEPAEELGPYGGLEVSTGGDLAETARGGTAVVLLHGFGAAGNDLVSLARELARPRTRYIVPAGPLTLPSGGSAWWQLKQRPTYDAEQELVVDETDLRQARRAVQGVLTTLRERYAPDELFVAGFSQGAMLALDVALQAASGVERVAVLSGALPQPSARALGRKRKRRPRVFVSHGRQDRVLRFAGAEHLVERLEQAHYSVSFQPFDGGHEIPENTRAALRDFFG